MATLAEMIGLMREHLGEDVPPAAIDSFERELRMRWPGERVYIVPNDSKKDPKRAEAIKKAAKRLPVAVVSERFGVSRQRIYQIVRRG